jgi:hypothetical protein
MDDTSLHYLSNTIARCILYVAACIVSGRMYGNYNLVQFNLTRSVTTQAGAFLAFQDSTIVAFQRLKNRSAPLPALFCFGPTHVLFQ